MSKINPWRISAITYMEVAQGCRSKEELQRAKRGLERKDTEIFPLTTTHDQCLELVEADRDDPEITHVLGKIPEHGERVLRVVFNGTRKPMKVVTVDFDRAMRGKL